MDYQMITDPSAPQWFYRINGETAEDGTRWYDNHLLVAMGRYYGEVGDRLKVAFESGQEVDVILGDSKGDRCSHPDGSMVEFIVDDDVIGDTVWRDGNLESIYGGKITHVWKYLEV